MVPLQVDLIDTDNGHGILVAIDACIGHRRAKKNLVGHVFIARRFWIDHFRNVQPLGQETQTAVDLAQAFLAILVVGVLASVAILGGP